MSHFLLFSSLTFLSLVWTGNAVPGLSLLDDAGKAVIKLSKVRGALPESQIDELAELARHPGGLKQIGTKLGAQNLDNIVLEDAYLRVAVTNGQISKNSAYEIFKNLSGTEGLRAGLRKVNSVSPPQSKGHLKELFLANEAHKRGAKVIAIGRKFDDGLKRADTDIDVLVRYDKFTFAIESKDYTKDVPLDMIRKDVASLFAYKNVAKTDNIVPVFATNAPLPVSVTSMPSFQKCQFLSGTPSGVAAQIEMLSKIL